jgi:hypothetical protein
VPGKKSSVSAAEIDKNKPLVFIELFLLLETLGAAPKGVMDGCRFPVTKP